MSDQSQISGKVKKLEFSNSKKYENSKIELTPNALRVLEKRYLKKDENAKPIESPEDLFHRVAKNIASVETLYDPNADVEKMKNNFYSIMSRLEFLPNSPTLMNAGRELQQLSACFVLPVEDSMESIFKAIKNTALIHKSGGGTGFSFSCIRPKNDVVKTTQGVSSGPISFMSVFDAATETIKQGGTRRGANMGILRVDHPDIMDFITCKEKLDMLNNFNISVGLDEKLMNAVENDEEYSLINPRTKEEVKKLNARTVFKKIVEMAWKNAEPGIIFLDRLNKDNPTPALGEIESTNPCGEQPLLPYESCNLGSINLSKMTRKNGGKTEIDYDKLKKIIHTAVRFLDNVIDASRFPLKEIEEKTKANRKIGLGVMGFADMLIKLGISYNSTEAVKLGDEIMSFIQKESEEMSHQLAEERGSFPNFSQSIYKDGPPIRNATTTTIAPTGTLSIIAGVSSGIEPIFAVAYFRQNILDDDKMAEVHPLFLQTAKEQGFYSLELMAKISKRGSIQDIEEIPQDVKRIFMTAHDIEPEWHVEMQASFQHYTDNAVSKTVNFQKDATPEDIEKVYMLAYKKGCKGVTIYRDGSREGVLVTKDSIKKEEKITPRGRPHQTVGTTQKTTTGCGNLYITINEDEHGPCEIFAMMGKSGGCAASQAEATGRLVSLALRSGIDVEAIIQQLKGIRCPSPIWSNGGMVLSCSDAIAKSLELYWQQKESSNSKITFSTKALSGIYPECPECGSTSLAFGEGCVTCQSCGYTKCS